MNPPVIECAELPAFDAENLAEISAAFQRSSPCVLGQAWREEAEADFVPAMVRTGWRGASLLVFAELTDVDIFNSATELNQLIWQLGDCLEIFLQPPGQAAYSEFHISPENQRLQFRFADAQALERVRSTGVFKPCMVEGEAFRSRTWVRPELRQWFVYAEIPATSVCDAPEPLANSSWNFSFSRYDYTRGRKEPVISSTSPHQMPNFHRRHEWGVINFR